MNLESLELWTQGEQLSQHSLKQFFLEHNWEPGVADNFLGELQLSSFDEDPLEVEIQKSSEALEKGYTCRESLPVNVDQLEWNTWRRC